MKMIVSEKVAKKIKEAGYNQYGGIQLIIWKSKQFKKHGLKRNRAYVINDEVFNLNRLITDSNRKD